MTEAYAVCIILSDECAAYIAADKLSVRRLFMGFKKCPKCELNYIKDDEKLCNVCRRSSKHEPEPDEDLMCIECGEHPALKGRDICAYCFKESLRQEQLANQRKSHISGIDLDDVELKEVDVTLPDEELPVDDIPDEFREETEEEDKSIEDEDTISIEEMEDDEADFIDEDEEVDEGFTPARKKYH